ncbi:MAG: prepilin peptidase [Bacillus sp. (in: Bacteria)]|nr:prepilin peptidase [Bacillus sp. (in: firmicutes)]
MLLNLLLIIVLIICVVTDLKSRKIYNKVIFPSLLLALTLNILFHGWSGLQDSLLGFLLGLGILLIPYMMGGMGAGDVKLLALIGAIMGPAFVFSTTIYIALLGGVFGIVILLVRSGIFQNLKSTITALRGITYGIKPELILKKGLKTKFPYGVAIAGGALLAFFINGVAFL